MQQRDQWSRIEAPDTITVTYLVVFFFYKDDKIYIGEKTVSSTNGTRKTEFQHAEKLN